MVRASLALDTEGDDISLLGDKTYLTGGGVYPSWDETFRTSTEIGCKRSSKVKQATSSITQYFNATLN